MNVDFLVPAGFEMQVDQNCKVSAQKFDQELAPSTSEFYCGYSKDKRIDALSVAKKDASTFIQVGTG